MAGKPPKPERRRPSDRSMKWAEEHASGALEPLLDRGMLERVLTRPRDLPVDKKIRLNRTSKALIKSMAESLEIAAERKEAVLSEKEKAAVRRGIIRSTKGLSRAEKDFFFASVLSKCLTIKVESDRAHDLRTSAIMSALNRVSVEFITRRTTRE